MFMTIIGCQSLCDCLYTADVEMNNTERNIHELDNWGSIPGMDNDVFFSICDHIQISSVAHPASCEVTAGGSYQRDKAARE